MSDAYAEIFDGATLMRRAPGVRHEIICARLHRCVLASVSNMASTRLLPPRTEIRVAPRTTLCPDLSLITAATSKLWLAAEIVSSDDHRPDTVIKKQFYEDMKIPRLWMIDPRYDNIEVYHSSQYGLVLKQILAGRELLEEKLLPEFQLATAELFHTPA